MTEGDQLERRERHLAIKKGTGQKERVRFGSHPLSLGAAFRLLGAVTFHAAVGISGSVSATDGIIPFNTRSSVIVWLHTPCELK
jgi:hypothetical protein